MTKTILGSLIFSAAFAFGQDALPVPTAPPVPQPPKAAVVETLPAPVVEVVPKPQDFDLPTAQTGVQTVDGEVVNSSPASTPVAAVAGTETQTVDTFTQEKAQHFSAIFNEMKRRGFQDGFGHTVAAAKLSDCLADLTAVQKVEDLILAIRALGKSNHAVISSRFQRAIAQDSAISALAATLVCKKGTRSPEEMVLRVEVAYSQLFNEKWLSLDAIHNVAVAANLLN